MGDIHRPKDNTLTTSIASRSTRIAAVLATVTLTLAACGGDSDGDGNDSSKDNAVTFFLDFAASVDTQLDKECVEQAVDTLSDADAKTLGDLDVATLSESDPEFNEAIDVVGDRVFDECITEE